MIPKVCETRLETIGDPLSGVIGPVPFVPHLENRPFPCLQNLPCKPQQWCSRYVARTRK
jgi:hypothetical protein